MRWMLAFVLVVTAPLAHTTPSAQQPSGAFRSRITVVPMDVRVIDRDGRPITDLRREDFEVYEEDIRQEITHFAVQTLTPAPAATATPIPLRRPSNAPPEPQNSRVFLMLLGRGRLQEPTRSLDALVQFIRTRLLPQDHVAVLAYNRATGFTTNHELAARTIESFRSRHEQIETNLQHWFSGLQAVYGSKEIPPHIQKRIDAIFSGADPLGRRTVTPVPGAGSPRIADDRRKTADDLQRADLLKERVGGISDPSATLTASLLDMDFDAYVSQQPVAMQDLGNLYAGIDYLRYMDGEKHLVYLTENGLRLPRQEDDRDLARVASDARVVIDIVRTGGVVGAPPPDSRSSYALPTPAMVFAQTASVQDARLITDITGGRSAAFITGEAAFRAIDEGTRVQYQLAYAPANTTTDGRFRHIKVKVNRPGARVFYRQGYYASERLVPLDRRAFLTMTRVAAAAQYAGTVEDIKVTLGKPVVVGTGDARRVQVPITVRSPRTQFESVDGKHVATLEVAIFCGDGSGQVVGESWQKMDLKLSDESFRQFQSDGGTYLASVPVKANWLSVKVVVYDAKTDLLGSAVKRRF